MSFSFSPILAAVLFTAHLLAVFGSAQMLTFISYDDGSAEDGLWLGAEGHAVMFSVPPNFTLSMVGVMGRLNSSAGLFVLEVWDENLNVLYSRMDVSRAYFGNDLAWSEIDIPDIRVPQNFFLCFFELSTIYVGVDIKNASSGRSFTVSRNPSRINQWALGYPRDRTEWMIRAIGYAITPPPRLRLSTDLRPDAVRCSAEMEDLDGNLAAATIYVLENRTGTVVWSDQRAVSGAKAKAEFLWTRHSYNASSGDMSVGPVFATGVHAGENEQSRYLTHSAPCILITGKDTAGTPAISYFGEDGELHAMLDESGRALYRSMELSRALWPDISYGEYNRNTTVKEGASSLSFYSMNLIYGISPLQPIQLNRSPLQHYGVRLNQVAARGGEYAVMVEGSDSAGNIVRAFEPPIMV